MGGLRGRAIAIVRVESWVGVAKVVKTGKYVGKGLVLGKGGEVTVGRRKWTGKCGAAKVRRQGRI
jgi:hypothetical protein